MMSLMARMRELTRPTPPVELPGVSGQLRFVDDHGHSFTAYRWGPNSWVLDHTAHTGGEVLRFYSTAQLVHELNRRSAISIEVTGVIDS